MIIPGCSASFFHTFWDSVFQSMYAFLSYSLVFYTGFALVLLMGHSLFFNTVLVAIKVVCMKLSFCVRKLDVMLQLSDLVIMDGYSDWIRLVAEFTSKSLLSWQVSSCKESFM